MNCLPLRGLESLPLGPHPTLPVLSQSSQWKLTLSQEAFLTLGPLLGALRAQALGRPRVRDGLICAHNALRSGSARRRGSLPCRGLHEGGLRGYESQKWLRSLFFTGCCSTRASVSQPVRGWRELPKSPHVPVSTILCQQGSRPQVQVPSLSGPLVLTLLLTKAVGGYSFLLSLFPPASFPPGRPRTGPPAPPAAPAPHPHGRLAVSAGPGRVAQ